jgi:iron complex outermembrane receptor protein
LHCWFDQFIGSAQYGGAGKIYWTEANDISQNFYGTLNMKAGVRKGDVTASVWTRNLTNTDYSAFYFESFGRQFMQKGKPFQIGVELSVAF